MNSHVAIKIRLIVEMLCKVILTLVLIGIKLTFSSIIWVNFYNSLYFHRRRPLRPEDFFRGARVDAGVVGAMEDKWIQDKTQISHVKV